VSTPGANDTKGRTAGVGIPVGLLAPQGLEPVGSADVLPDFDVELLCGRCSCGGGWVLSSRLSILNAAYDQRISVYLQRPSPEINREDSTAQ